MLLDKKRRETAHRIRSKEQHCKPGYVVNGHLSRTCVTAGLKRPTRDMTGRHIIPARTCFGWGLQCGLCYQRSGSLLHCHFTLTAYAAVYFLLHFP